VTFTRGIRALSQKLLPDTADFTTSLYGLNRHVFENLKYTPGATDVTTSVAEVLSHKEGVCQDFAHLMIAICRMAGIPARYVSGYIETDPAPEGALVGATASHAWVEVLAPNGYWVGFDPTNNILEGERHVQIGVGRDYLDVPPMKGTYKGTNRQTLSVDVRVRRGAPAVLPAR
jgi:transglutaminase-like putative cysteine protease